MTKQPTATIKRKRRRLYGPADDFIWEVDAPVGWRFTEELHGYVAESDQEAERLAKTPLERCPEDCDCGDGTGDLR